MTRASVGVEDDTQEVRGGRPYCRGGHLWYGGERPGIEEGALVWRTVGQCAGAEDSVPVLRRAP